MKRFFGRAAAVLLLLATLSGCSALRLAYDNADTYLRWRASGYLDLHGDDADDLDARIQDLLAWHRKNALPQYARLTDEAVRRFSKGVSRGDLEWGYDAVIAQVRESLRAVAERAAPLLDRLSPEQIAHLEQRFAEDNRAFAREFMRGTERERRQRRYERMVERLEDWVGKLSEAQLARVRLYSERTQLQDELRDRERKRVQREIVAMARAKEARKRLPAFAERFDQGRDAALAAATEEWKRELFAMSLDLDRMLTPEQRGRAAAQLNRYARDMRTLASRAASAKR